MKIKNQVKGCRVSTNKVKKCYNVVDGNGNTVKYCSGGECPPIVASEEYKLQNPHKFKQRTSTKRQHELNNLIDTASNIQLPPTIKDFVTFQDASWNTLQRTVQNAVQGKQSVHSGGSIAGELVFFVQKGIVTRGKSVAGTSKKATEKALGCQTSKYNRTAGVIAGVVADAVSNNEWDRLWSVAAEGILNTNRPIYVDKCIELPKNDEGVIRGDTSEAVSLDSSACRSNINFDPCRGADGFGECGIAGWGVQFLVRWFASRERPDSGGLLDTNDDGNGIILNDDGDPEPYWLKWTNGTLGNHKATIWSRGFLKVNLQFNLDLQTGEETETPVYQAEYPNGTTDMNGVNVTVSKQSLGGVSNDPNTPIGQRNVTFNQHLAIAGQGGGNGEITGVWDFTDYDEGNLSWFGDSPKSVGGDIELSQLDQDTNFTPCCRTGEEMRFDVNALDGDFPNFEAGDLIDIWQGPSHFCRTTNWMIQNTDYISMGNSRLPGPNASQEDTDKGYENHPLDVDGLTPEEIGDIHGRVLWDHTLIPQKNNEYTRYVCPVGTVDGEFKNVEGSTFYINPSGKGKLPYKIPMAKNHWYKWMLENDEKRLNEGLEPILPNDFDYDKYFSKGADFGPLYFGNWDGQSIIQGVSDVIIFGMGLCKSLPPNSDMPDPITLVSAGNFVVGKEYTIVTLGYPNNEITDYEAIGAAVGAKIGDNFTATGVGSGNGKAKLVN